MKHRIIDSNAPPQSRGTPVQCLNAYPDSTRLIGTDRPQKRAYRMHECVNEERLQDQGCSRFARGKPVVAAKTPALGVLFRPTGRDGPARLCNSGGPPVSIMFIRGAPAWLISEGEGRGEGRGVGKKQRAESREQRAEGRELRAVARGKPLTARSQQPAARGKPPMTRGKTLTARGQPPVARDRGHPPEVEYDVFHRAKLPEMGEVWKKVRSRKSEAGSVRRVPLG